MQNTTSFSYLLRHSNNSVMTLHDTIPPWGNHGWLESHRQTVPKQLCPVNTRETPGAQTDCLGFMFHFIIEGERWNDQQTSRPPASKQRGHMSPLPPSSVHTLPSVTFSINNPSWWCIHKALSPDWKMTYFLVVSMEIKWENIAVDEFF